MYVFEFIKNKNITIDYNTRFSLFDSLEMLRKWNTKAVSENIQFVISYKVFDEVSNEVVLVDKMSIGTNYTIDFFRTTKDRLKGLYANDELTNILNLIETIEAQYQSEKDEYYANKSVEIRDEIMESEDQSINNVTDKNQFQNNKKSKKLLKVTKHKNHEKEKKSDLGLISFLNKLPHLIRYSLLAVILICVMGTASLISNLAQSNSDQKISYDELIESEQYLMALEKYPQKYAEIEQLIFQLGDSGTSYLAEFIEKKSDYKQAQLDLAYLKKDYKEVLNLGLAADTDQRKAQVIIAYINQGDFENATELNRVVHDKALNALIDEAYFYLIVDSLNSGDLEEVAAYQDYANNPEINQMVESIQSLDNQIVAIETLPEKEKNGFINEKKLDDLKQQKLEILNHNIFSDQNQMISLSSIVISVLVIIIFIFLGYFGFKQYKNKKPNVKISGFNELLNNELYMEALKRYPQKYPEIERQIFQLGERAIPHLEEFINKKKGYKQAQFDLAFLKKEYSKVIKLEKFADTDGRKVQLVTAYIHLGKIDQANEINQYIQIPEFSHYLSEHYYQLTVEALNNDDFSLAQHYQELSNSNDIDYLIETIRLIDGKIQNIEEKIIGSKNDNTDEKSKLQKLKEMRSFSLELN